MLENLILWAMALWERFKEWYFKLFPAVAILFAITYAIGIAGTADRGFLSVKDLPSVIIVCLIFTVLVMHYVICYLRHELNRRDGR